MGILNIVELLKSRKYWNIIAMILAMKGNRKFLVEWLGEREAFETLKRIKYYKEFSFRIGNLEKYPIALTPCGNIYIDHYQVAAAYLAGLKEIGFIQKKIPCSFTVFDDNWARATFKNFEEIQKFYQTLNNKPE